MSKTAMVRARIQPDLKNRAERVLNELGLTATQAITLFYKQVEMRKELPFNIIIATKTTRRTFDGTDAGRDVILCKDADDMFRKLGI
jgi:DNA-damage-inducible protein J